MKILVVEQHEDIRNDIIRRVEEAARRTTVKSVSVFGNTLAELGSFLPDLLVLGPFACNSFEDVSRRLEGIFPRVPLCLLLGSEEYVSEAIEIRRRNIVRVVAMGDLPQIAQVIMDAAHGGTRGRAIGPQGRIVSVVHTRGGVGASSLVASLGQAAASKKISTVLIDLGVVGADISRWAGYDIASQAALRQLYNKGQIPQASLKDILVSAPGAHNNLFVLGEFENYQDAYRYHIGRPDLESVNFDIFEKLTDSLASEFELLVFDVGREWGLASLTALALSTHVFLVADASFHSLLRSFESVRRMSIESDDPFEFDFRKWSVVLNGESDNAVCRDIMHKVNNVVALPSFISEEHPEESNGEHAVGGSADSRVFALPRSKKGAEWMSGQKTLYELADRPYQIAIESILSSIFPALDFPR